MSKVVYRKNGGRRRAGYPLLVLCAVLLFGFSLVNIVWPKRTQLELENRKAAQLPAFSACALQDGSWQSGFARWMQDQFSLRDAAVHTRRAADEVLLLDGGRVSESGTAEHMLGGVLKADSAYRACHKQEAVFHE